MVVVGWETEEIAMYGGVLSSMVIVAVSISF